jgi:peptide deformylase
VKLKIWQVGEAVLRRPSRPLTAEEIIGREIQELIAAMRDTMRDAPGVGLAAPQVGLNIQLAVIEDRPEYLQKVPQQQLEERRRRPVPFHVLVNPKLTIDSAETVEFFEGCLSLAGFTAIVPRATRVRVEYLDEQAQPREIVADGWYARILQHEIDHLRGALYIDRMDTRSFATIENYMKHSAVGPTRSSACDPLAALGPESTAK